MTRADRQNRIAERCLSAPLKAYLFLLVLLAPIDYLRPTALVFREGGARPAILLMSCGSAWIFICRWRYLLFKAPALWIGVIRTFCLIGLLGTLAFCMNLVFGISYVDGSRTPLGQFWGQFPLFLLVPFVLIGHADLLCQPERVRYMLQQVPLVLAVHIGAVWMEAARVLNPLAFPLSLFRVPDTPVGRRAAGMMTEPSYVAVLAGVYGIVCVMISLDRKGTWLRRGIAAGGVITAFALGAKTIVPVSILGVFGLFWQRRVSLLSVRSIAAGCVVTVGALYNVLTYSALDIRENLSSAMRLGSANLAWNAAKAGYGVFGVGFGQFHFLYQERFAPWFLLYSAEAMDAFSHNAATRASSYNMFLRYLIETGISGLLLFLVMLGKLLINARRHDSAEMQLGVVLTCGSIGFLLTQDPYFFPMFVLGLSILMGLGQERTGKA